MNRNEQSKEGTKKKKNQETNKQKNKLRIQETHKQKKDKSIIYRRNINTNDKTILELAKK